MAILNFLKRKKTRDLNIPSPPGLDLPDLPELPDLEAIGKEDVPELELPELPELGESEKPVHDASDLSLPELPDLPEIKQDVEKIPEPHKIHEMPARVEHPMPKIVERKTTHAPKPVEEHRKLTHVESNIDEVHEGPIYIKAYNYKNILDSIESVKNRLKKTEDILKELNKIKNAKDKEFEKYRNYLEDVQRKSLVIDKSLFKKG